MATQMGAPSPRFGHVSAVVGGKLYVWGGHTKDFTERKRELASTVHCYDSLLETWTANTCSGDPPPGLYLGACATAGHHVYVYGGYDGVSYHNSLHQLDTRTLTWRELSRAHTKKIGCRMVAHDKKLILFGGRGIPSGLTQPGAEFVVGERHSDGRGLTNELYTFDLTLGTWSSLEVSGIRPPPCVYPSFTMVDYNRVVLFGGSHPEKGETNDVYILDLTRMHWSKLDQYEGDPCPVGRDSHAAVCLDYGDHPQLFMTGGIGGGNKALSDSWMLDVQSGRWREVKIPGLNQSRFYHSAASFGFSPRLTDIAIFGGCPEWPSNHRRDADLPQIANTTLLTFESQQHPSTDGSSTREWVLTDMAEYTQLATRERKRARMKKIQATYTVEATGDGTATEGGIDVGSGKFLQRIQEAVSNRETVSRKLAHSILVGPYGSGKSSLMDRLLKRPRKMFSLSTGVCDPVVMVDIDVDNPSTFHSVTVIDSNTWEEVEYDISLVRQMNMEVVTTPLEHVQPKLSTSLLEEIDSTPTETASSFPESAQLPEHHLLHTNQIEAVTAKPVTSSAKKIKLSNKRINEAIMVAVDKCGGFECFRKSFKGASLYLRDAGGQVEFQEMISLLIFGPSIFLFVFRVDLDFQSKFSIEYRASKSESTNCYTSSITIEEALLQCFASVYAMDTTSEVGVKTHKPLVLIIGTHTDKLGPLADEKITKLNQHLDSLIVKSGFQDIVQYADAGKGQVLFAVDNTSESDEDFKAIRSKVHGLISGRKEFTIEYPIAYLLFCLELQNLKRRILTLNECIVMAAKYGIEGDEVSHLLQFLHLRIGVIQYHDVDGLRHIIIKEPQVLFNKVTKLITRTFSCKALTTKEQRDFQKGILTASALESILSYDDEITSEDFLKLLMYLRIITPYPSTTPGDQEKRYFLPCVLNHVKASSEESLNTDIMPLHVQFRCLHCPKGLFGVLITHLMTPEESCKSLNFILIEEKLFKDQVSFRVRSCSTEDEMSLKFLLSHIEITFFRSLSEDRDLPIGEVCSNVREVIETSIHRSLEDLHYNKRKVEPMMSLRCEDCSKLHQILKGKGCHKFYCEVSRSNCRLPLRARYWYNEVGVSSPSVSPPNPANPVVSKSTSVLPTSRISKCWDDGDFPGIIFWDAPIQKTITPKGCTIQSLNTGISLTIPEHSSLSAVENMNISIRPCFNGPFVLPDGYEAVSPAYLIQMSNDTKFQGEATLKIHHYARLQAKEDCEDMVFLSASATPQYRQFKPVYIFNEIKGSNGFFIPRSQIGKITIQHFCFMLIGWLRKLSGADIYYSARLYRIYSSPDVSAVFSMCHAQKIYTTHCDDLVEQQFKVSLRNNHLALITGEEVTLQISKQKGWFVNFDKNPPKIYKRDLELKELAHYPPMFNIFVQPTSEVIGSFQTPELLVKGIYQPCSFEIVLPVFNAVTFPTSSHSGSAGSRRILTLPASVRPHLDQQLDWDSKGVDNDLTEIAKYMLNWEEDLCTPLGLSFVDVNDIKVTYPSKPKTQRQEALRIWKSNQGLEATYRNLLEMFENAGNSRCADAVCMVIRKKLLPPPTGYSRPAKLHEQSLYYKGRENLQLFLLFVIGVLLAIIIAILLAR